MKPGSYTRARTREPEALLREPLGLVLSTPETNPWYVFTHLEAEIKQTDSNSEEQAGFGLRARWKFGQELLARREPGGRGAGRLSLPVGLLDTLAEQCRVSREEIQKRMQFAERYPTEEELRNGITQFPSWYQMVAKGLRRPKPEASAPGAKDDAGNKSPLQQFRAFAQRIQHLGPAGFRDDELPEVVETLEGLLGLFQSYQVGAESPRHLRRV